MSEDKAIAILRPEREVGATIDRYAFEPSTWTDAAKMAEALSKSGLLPDELKSPQAALVVIIQGRELGLTVMQSLRGISVIKGKPAPSAQLMVALVKKSPACERFECLEATATQATWVTKRRGESEHRLTWTIEDARRAGLASGAMYSKFPRNMLKWRAASDLAREVYPDVVGGMYTAEELSEYPSTTEPEIVQQRAAQEATEALPTTQPAARAEPDAKEVKPAPGVEAPRTPGRRSFKRVIEEAGGTIEEAKGIAREIWGVDDLAKMERQDLEMLVTEIQQRHQMAAAIAEDAKAPRVPGVEG